MTDTTDAQRYAQWLRGECPTAGCDGDGCEYHDAASLLEVLGEIAQVWDSMLETANQTIDRVQGTLDEYLRTRHQPTTTHGQAALAAHAIHRARTIVGDYVRARDADF